MHHTLMRARARARAHTHTHTHTHKSNDNRFQRSVSQAAMKHEGAFTAVRSGRAQALHEKLANAGLPPVTPLASLGAKAGRGPGGRPLESGAAEVWEAAVDSGKRLAAALGDYAGAAAELPPDYWRTGRAWQWREALSGALRDPSAAVHLCMHFQSSEERMVAQGSELRAVQVFGCCLLLAACY